ncbi:hypothetical protein H705_00198 [Bartonella bacilliformis Cond044]|nr:hypothetical protein H705_00198 [Bartonella bacilliformis Cond044]KEG23584.1 hypothetical protein H703_00195 [Bartonella bacilliformis Ver075]
MDPLTLTLVVIFSASVFFNFVQTMTILIKNNSASAS